MNDEVYLTFVWILYEGLASYTALAVAKVLYVPFYTFLTKNYVGKEELYLIFV